MWTNRIRADFTLWLFASALVLLFAFSVRADEPKPRYLYLLPKPEVHELKVSKASQIADYTLQLSYSGGKYFVNLALGQEALAHLGDFLGVDLGPLGNVGPHLYATFHLGLDLLRVVPYAAVWNAVDLGIQQAHLDRRLFEKIEKVPGFKKVFVMNGGSSHSWLTIPQSQTSENVLVIETSEPLPREILEGTAHAGWDPKWPKPIAIEDPDQTKVRVRLVVDGKTQPETWDVSLHELGLEKKIPAALAERWRSAIRASDKLQPYWLTRTWRQLRYFESALPDRVHLEASVLHPTLGEVDMKTVAVGNKVRHVLNLGVKPKILWLAGFGNFGQFPVQTKEPAKPSCGIDYETLVRMR